MLDVLLALLQTAVFCAIATAFLLPALRRKVAWSILALGALALLGGLLAGGTRRLDVSAAFPTFRTNQIGLFDFPIETVEAPGFAFGLVCLLFLGLWAAVLLWIDRRTWPPGELRPAAGSGVPPFGLPLLLAWSGIAFILALEKTAAPAGLVRPVPFDRVIFPASIAAAALLAIRLRSVMPALLWVCLLVSAARWPIAAIATWVSEAGLGTSLDVHSITDFANPFAQVPVHVLPRSGEQFAWLIWAPQLLLLPAFYLFSAGGIAFAVAMFVLHPPEGRGPHAEQPAGPPNEPADPAGAQRGTPGTR
ncbi:MAG: hypothetical protein IT457_15980 [Planctomycetes bacterium]|nr:hypothetical protein [Planctomycetota bacterium]